MSEPINPYEPGISESHGPSSANSGPFPANPGMIRQVPVVAILSIIQGSLEVLVGLFFVAMGPIVGTVMQNAELQNPNAQPPPEEMMWFVYGLYGAMGLMGLLAGAIKIAAGVQNLKYKNRVLGFVAMGSCIASLFTCYCIPTAIALAIYGLIVLCDGGVARAFQLASQGYTPQQIKQGI